MNEWLWLAAAFISGSVPYSLLLGKFLLHRDIRQFGDGNPGATNLVRAGGRWWGGLAILLDGFKAAVPVGWVYWFDRPALPWMAAIAVAPVLGHAYSPFLRGRGGKAITAMFGVWTGLTLFEAPVILGIAMGLLYLIFENSGWVVLLSQGVLGAFIWMYHPDYLLGIVWAMLLLLSIWKHRADFTRPAVVRASLLRLISGHKRP